MHDDLPEKYRLSYFLGEIVRNDSVAEHETRVLWNRLHVAGLGDPPRQRDFGRLLPQVRTMLGRPEVPQPFRRFATQAVDLAIRSHRLRKDLVHDILMQPGWRDGSVISALGQHPERKLEEVWTCAEDLRTTMYRMRGLWIIAPHWVGGPVDDPLDVDDLHSWTRVALGHIADDPGFIRGTPGKAPTPPSGWRDQTELD